MSMLRIIEWWLLKTFEIVGAITLIVACITFVIWIWCLFPNAKRIVEDAYRYRAEQKGKYNE